MNDLKIFEDIKTMSSLEIASLTGKRHDHVLRDIRNILKSTGKTINPTTYIDSKGESRPCYNLPIDVSNLLLDKYKGLARVPNRLQEEAALKTIEQVLNIQLIRQFQVGGYRIDGYDSVNNIAYEIDEPDHKYKLLDDSERQKNIQNILNCKFIRIKL